MPQHAIGIATAARQFFQQTGQTFGAAVFGVVLAGAAITSLEARLGEQAARPPAMQTAGDLAVTRALRAEIHDLRTAAPVRRSDQARPPEVVRAHREAYAAGLGRVWRHAALLPLVGAALTLVLAWIVSPQKRKRQI